MTKPKRIRPGRRGTRKPPDACEICNLTDAPLVDRRCATCTALLAALTDIAADIPCTHCADCNGFHSDDDIEEN